MTVSIEPSLEYVFSIQAEIDRPKSAGPSPLGERLHIPIVGGTVFGPKLSGVVLPGGSDWPVIGPDGNSHIEAHYTLELDDGTLIYVVNRGLRVSDPAITKQLRAGEIVSPDLYYMRGVPTFDVPDGPHSWLRNNIFVCTITPNGVSVLVKIFRVT